MKSKISLLFAFVFALFLTANAVNISSSSVVSPLNEDKTSMDYLSKNNPQAFLDLTPKAFEKMTGKKLSLTEVVKLKMAQKMLKSQLKNNAGGDGMSKGLFILLALLGWAWIPMGIQDDWSGSTWWTNLLLTVLCWLPGFIHALVKMKDYTK